MTSQVSVENDIPDKTTPFARIAHINVLISANYIEAKSLLPALIFASGTPDKPT
jgi:hypothetical protein